MILTKRIFARSDIPRRFAERCSGSVAVEAALAILVMMLILLPLIDFGRYIDIRIELKQALRASGQYALIDLAGPCTAIERLGATFPACNTSITSAVTGSANLSNVNVTINPLTCECFDALDPNQKCPGFSGYFVCTGNVAPGGFVQISASVTFDPYFINAAGFSSNMTVSESMTLRVF